MKKDGSILMITAKGGNNMNEESERKIQQWEQYENKLRNKIRHEKDEDKRDFLKKKLSETIEIKQKLRDIQWREL